MSTPKQVQLRSLLRLRLVWIAPAALAGILIALISVIYIGSVVNPTGHLHDLPVLVVNEDQGTGQQHLGAQLASALDGSTKVTQLLELRSTTLAEAQHRMDHGKAYAALVIPADFSAKPTAVTILTNQRAGTLGTSLATGVLEPAIAAIMPAVTIATQIYDPLPNHSALGLSAFYVALLTLMCGFLVGTIVNSSFDSAIGFAPTEIGPRWRLRRPVPLTRWQTLRGKWALAAVITPVLDGLMVIIGVGLLHMYAPNVAILWLFTSFAAIVVALGTLVLFAAFGSLGQLLAMIGFLYLSLASSGGTIPIAALPTPLQWAADIEPLRQILDGVRSIMYFNLRVDAGLTRGLVMTSVGLVFWLLAGAIVTRFYDRKGMARISPEVLAFINKTVGDYHDQRTATDANAAGPDESAGAIG